MSAPSVIPTDERQLFGRLLTPEFVNELQPPSPTTVYTPSLVVWLLIYQRLHANASLAEAVAEFLIHFPQQALPRARHNSDPTVSANTGAYSRARTRLDTALARRVADHTTRTLLDATPPSWNGRRVFLLDGTTVQLTHTPELCEAFPPAGNQHGPSHWPILHLLVAHELDSALALRPEFGPMYGPEATSELALTLRILPRLPADAVVLADRNFGVFAVAHAARSSGRDVVVRLTRPRFRALCKGATPEGPGRWSLVWRASRWDRSSHPELAGDAEVRGWLVEVRVSRGLTLWLFTTCSAPGGELASLYRRRMEVETDIRDIKQTLAMDRMTGKGRAMVEKELVLGVLAYNLVNQVRRLAARKAKVEPRRLGFAGVWSLVKAMLAAVADELPEEDWQRRFDQVLGWAGQRKLPRRPTQRSYPRTIIPRSTQFPKRKPTPTHEQD
jgi:hypothetical protein